MFDEKTRVQNSRETVPLSRVQNMGEKRKKKIHYATPSDSKYPMFVFIHSHWGFVSCHYDALQLSDNTQLW
jgi:hypothetical protein